LQNSNFGNKGNTNINGNYTNYNGNNLLLTKNSFRKDGNSRPLAVTNNNKFYRMPYEQRKNQRFSPIKSNNNNNNVGISDYQVYRSNLRMNQSNNGKFNNNNNIAPKKIVYNLRNKFYCIFFIFSMKFFFKNLLFLAHNNNENNNTNDLGLGKSLLINGNSCNNPFSQNSNTSPIKNYLPNVNYKSLNLKDRQSNNKSLNNQFNLQVDNRR